MVRLFSLATVKFLPQKLDYFLPPDCSSIHIAIFFSLQIEGINYLRFFPSCKSLGQKKHQRKRPANRMGKKTISGSVLQIAWAKKTSAETSCKSQGQKNHQRKRPANRMSKKIISGNALQIPWAKKTSAESPCNSQEQKKHQRNRPAIRRGKKTDRQLLTGYISNRQTLALRQNHIQLF